MTADPTYLGRQPILNQDHELVGYELLFRASPSPNIAVFSDGLQATATVVSNAFYELSLGNALGSNKGYINVDADFIASSAIELLPPDKVVLEILETVVPTPEVLARCQELRDKGYTFALDDFCSFTENNQPLLDLASIVKIDIQPLNEGELRRLTEQLRPYRKQLLAERVETRDQVDQCLTLGFDLFQGYYFARPTVIAGKKISHSRLTLMRLLTQVLEDAETFEIERTLKEAPGLSINLLRLTNSAGSGLRVQITSIRHAITVLGRNQLQRWLQLLMFTEVDGGASSPLLHIAATRARALELLADYNKPGDKGFADRAFMTGIMSLTPILLGLPIQEILSQLSNLPADLQKALIARDGPLGRMLLVVEALDGDEQNMPLPMLIEQVPGLSPERVNTALAQALAWATSISSGAPPDADNPA